MQRIQMERIEAQVCVLGGGPGGSSVARKLALLGHRVVLVEKAAFPRPHIGESLPASVIPLMETMGVRGRIEDAGFLRPESAIVHWAGSVREVRGQEQAGFQVDRPRFDGLLLDAAREAGARVVQPAPVESIESGWRVRARGPRGPLLIEADFLVDATGRAGLSGGRRVMQSAPLLALWAYWRRPHRFGPETRVESGDAEWFWGAPLPDGSYNATVLIDPRRYRERERPALYEALLGRSKLLRECLGEERLTRVAVCDATPYRAVEMIPPRVVKVGEAAFALDPLSSQGVQTAMGSGLHAAAAIHTMVRLPDSSGLAADFYASRQDQAATLHRQAAEELYRQAADYHGSEFWRSRTGAAASAAEPNGAPRTPLPPPDGILVPAEGVGLSAVPCLCGDYIVSMRGVGHLSTRRPLVFLDDVAVAELWTLVRWPARAADIVRTWTARVGAEMGLRVLARLWQSGLLRLQSTEQEGADFTRSSSRRLPN
jgi:flavin-dependent dehydrogenase